MKTIKILGFASVVLLATSLFIGCTEDFEELNTNQRALTQLDASMLGNMFARIQYRGHSIYDNQVPQTLFGDYFTQYTSNIQNAFPSDRYQMVGGWINSTWARFYGGNLGGNMEVLLEETDPAEYPERANMHAIAQIWRVINYERFTNEWGPVPYFSVNNGELVVPYDSEEDIYMDYFTRLDNALAILKANPNQPAYGSNDQVYGGDVAKWIVFGNTLRLRIAMRISEVVPSVAQQQAEKAVADGVMDSNDYDALFQCTPNSRHGNPRMIPWAEFRMSATMESVLQGYQDPRMPLMYLPAVTDGEIRGLRNGYTVADLGGIAELLPDNLSQYGPRYHPVSTQDNLLYEIMWSPEAWFLRAEGVLKGWNMGGGTAEEYYNNGIEASFTFWTQWGLDMGTLADYQQSTLVPVPTWDAPEPISDVPVLFSDDPAVQLEQIAIQKWIALFPDGWEAWADQRRRELPRRYDIMATENPNLTVKMMPRRLPYVSSEFEQNADGVAVGVGLLGGPDNAATRLWWNPAK